MNAVIMRKITLTASYQPLTSVASEIASVEISADPDNVSDVIFKGDGGDEIPWDAGEWHSFKSVDLAQIYVKGNAGDTITVIGGTW